MGPQEISQVIVYFHFTRGGITRAEFKQYAVQNMGGFLVKPGEGEKYDAIAWKVHESVCQAVGSSFVRYYVVGERSYQIMRKHFDRVVDLSCLGCPKRIKGNDAPVKIEEWIQSQGWDEVD